MLAAKHSKAIIKHGLHLIVLYTCSAKVFSRMHTRVLLHSRLLSRPRDPLNEGSSFGGEELTGWRMLVDPLVVI